MSLPVSQTKITVDGNNVIFSNLSINQYMADVNSFSFTWRSPKNNNSSSYRDYVDFYKKNLSKNVTITINNDSNVNFSFTGFIYAISASGEDANTIEYIISGKGKFAKYDEIAECNSYYKKTILDIFSDIFKNEDSIAQPTNTSSLFYTVQYNQTNFDFIKLLAIRYGEWLFYDGQNMVLGPVFGIAKAVKIGTDINNVNISAKIFKSSEKNVGFNTFQGKILEKDSNDPSGVTHDIITSGKNGGQNAFGNKQTYTNSYTAITDDSSFNNSIKNVSDRQLQGVTSNTMYLNASSINSQLSLGNKISVKDEDNTPIGDYIITQINHFSASEYSYQNNFAAVPADLKVPPYCNPQLSPTCKPQPAIVFDNVDDKGLGRIKVHFPWQQQNETTPWIPVIVPHAGKDKGFLFLPEKQEQVMVDFIGGNAERPFIVGAFYAEDNGHGNDHTNNNIKLIGTKSGRRLEIDDNGGTLRLQDFGKNDSDGNQLVLVKNKDGNATMVSSHSDQKAANIYLKGKEGINRMYVLDGESICEIILDAAEKKILIHSKNSIDLVADQEINMNAATVNINAGNINFKASPSKDGGGGKIKIEGLEIKAEATTTMDLKGLNTTIKGDTQIEVSGAQSTLKGDAMTTIKGAIVMIN